MMSGRADASPSHASACWEMGELGCFLVAQSSVAGAAVAEASDADGPAAPPALAPALVAAALAPLPSLAEVGPSIRRGEARLRLINEVNQQNDAR